VTFTEADFGYSAPIVQSVTITNSGNVPTGTITIGNAVGDNDHFEFVLSGGGYGDSVNQTLTYPAVPPSSSGKAQLSISLRPKTGLAPGSHSATWTASDGTVQASFSAFFTVDSIDVKAADLALDTAFSYDGAPPDKKLVAPVAGAMPKTAVPDNPYYEGTIAWSFLGSGGQTKPQAGTFDPKTSYTATLTLTAKTGYDFAHSSAATYNDGAADYTPAADAKGRRITTLVSSNNQIVITVTFPVTGKPGEDDEGAGVEVGV
jgi:hypothetical protein